jgi:L-alanine-DL-glutamate epimerase-like enolase superfamily enzyme
MQHDAAPPAGGFHLSSIELTPLSVPLPRPFHAAVRVIESVDLILVTARDSGGIEGYGLSFAFGHHDARSIMTITQSLSPLLMGPSIHGPESAWQAMRSALEFAGCSGPALAAVSALDLALWDCQCRRAGLPLWRALGGARPTAPAYASAGSLALDPAGLVAEVAGLVEASHRAIKIKSRGDLAEDSARLAALRAEFGPALRIAVDANQSLTAKAAIRWARAIAEFDPWWIEEPVTANDLAGQAEVRHAIDCDLASGESLFGTRAALDTITARSADILMPNLQRVGGLSPWRKVAAHAEFAGLRIGAHVHPEYQSHLMCALPATVAVEIWPGWPWIWAEPLEVNDGMIQPPDLPGLGFNPDPDRVAAWRADR